jgi:hypothetical protein
MVKFDWNNDDYQDDRNFDPAPRGVYRMRCIEVEDKTTRSGGEMIAATFEIVGGDYNKRRVWHNFNIVNKSEQAERIGRSQVAAWARACGKPNASSTDQLLEMEFEARVKIEEQEGYKPRNVIDGFVAASGTPAPSRTQEPVKPAAPKPAAAPKAAAPKPAPAPAGGQKNPWED